MWDDLKPNVVNNKKHYVLEIAVAQRRVGIAKLLLNSLDINSNLVVRGCRTALMQAVDPDVVKLLLDQELGIEVD